MVWHYALNYGIHTFPNLLKNLLEILQEVKGKAFVYKQSHVPLSVYRQVISRIFYYSISPTIPLYF